MPAEAQQKKLNEIDHAVARRLFKEYVQAKKAAGQSTQGLSYGKMLAKLNAEAGRLKERLGPRTKVKFQVKTIDGKVRLRALRDRDAPAPTPPAPAKPPSVAPPPVPGAAGSKGKPPPIAPPVAVPKVPAPAKPLDETDEELGAADLDHDDLDEIEEVDEAEFDTAEDDSIRSTLEALMAEENEPLPVTAAGSDLTASQRVNFATLGDIAKRMDELADRRDAPKREAKAEKNRKVLEGESSGEADIRAVAESIKNKQKQKPAPAPEPGAPSGEIEGDSIPISLTDEDEVAPGGGFGAAAAVSLAEHKPIVSEDDYADEDEEAPTRAFRPGDAIEDTAPTEPEKPGGFPVGILLLLIVVVGGGVGYVMYGEQLFGGASGVASRAPDPPAPAPPELATNNEVVEAMPTESGDDASGDDEATDDETAAEAGAAAEAGDEDGEPTEGKRKKKKGKHPQAAATGDGETPLDDGGEAPPADGGEDPPPEEPPAENDGKQVDCLLNPDAPGCKTEEKVVEKKEAAPALPAKLTQNQLRDGFQKVKADAKTCGKHHGVESGTKVSVKVSIEGKTGGITKASPQGEYAGSALGKCVADALRRASFPAFASPSMGVTWTIRM